MAQSAGGNGIEDIYRGVINDVINGVREAFLDENVDIDVLQQLKTSWEAKVKQSGAVDLDGPKTLPPPTIRQIPNRQGQAAVSAVNRPSTSGSMLAGPSQPHKVQEPVQRQNVILSQHQQPQQPQTVQQVLGNGSGIQYLQGGSGINSAAQVLTSAAGSAALQLPPGFRFVTAAQNPSLAQYAIMQGIPGGAQNLVVIPAANNQQIPLGMANLGSQLSQQQLVNNPAARPQQPQIIAMKSEPNMHNNIGQLDGAGALLLDDDSSSKVDLPSSSKTKTQKVLKKKKQARIILQVDGGPGMSDSSSEDEMDEEDDDPLHRYAGLEDDKLDDGDVIEEDPLNSDDDQSDDEDLDTLFDAEHVVVCQFEKVHRARSKWKFTLKDGVMHLTGKDYVFQKCSGEAEW